MTRIAGVTAIALGCVMFWTGLAVGAEKLSSYNFLQDVSVDRTHGELLIQLKFRKPPVHFQGPDFFKKSIQMDFPFAYIDPAKQYFDTGDAAVPQVYVSQFDPQRLRLRLMLAPGTPDLKDRMVVEQVGNILRIRIAQEASVPIRMPLEKEDLLGSLLARASLIEKAHPIQTKTSSGQGITTEVSKLPPPVTQTTGGLNTTPAAKEIKKESPPLFKTLGQALKKERPKAASAYDPLPLKTRKAGILDFEDNLSIGNPDLLSASLKMTYTLILVLGLMFVVFYFFKKFGLKNSVFGGEGKPIKVLSTGFLAPRKSIALVEVAGDILVLGIAHDRISLLGNVQDPEKIEQIKSSLHKKGSGNKPAATQTPKEKQLPETQKPGVDVYNKRLVNPGSTSSTNPFGEYVKQFIDSSGTEKDSIREVASRVKKTLGEVPIFK